jgi:hypothetical protein
MDAALAAWRPLIVLGIPPAAARLVAFFARNATVRPSVRELQRTLAIASASVQRDLARLVAAGALTAQRDHRLVRYAVIPGSPIWQAVRLIISDPEPGSSTGERSVDSAVARARRYGVDIGQLRSTLRLSPEARIAQLEANATFLTAARASRAANAAKGLKQRRTRRRVRR